MKAYTGSVYVNDFNMFNRIYRVYIQAEAPYREHRDNIGLYFVRGSDGDMIPLTSLVQPIIRLVRVVLSDSICLILPLFAVRQPMAPAPDR